MKSAQQTVLTIPASLALDSSKMQKYFEMIMVNKKICYTYVGETAARGCQHFNVEGDRGARPAPDSSFSAMFASEILLHLNHGFIPMPDHRRQPNVLISDLRLFEKFNRSLSMATLDP